MATLDDIKAVLEGIRSDLAAGGGGGGGGSSDMDLDAQAAALRENTEAIREMNEGLEESVENLNEMGDSGSAGVDRLTASAGRGNAAFAQFFEGLKKMAEAAMEFANNTMDSVNELNKLTTSMRATTGASTKLVDNIGRVGDKLRLMGVEYAEVAANNEALMRGFNQYTRLSGGMQTQLLSHVSVLSEIGFAAEGTGKSMEFMTTVMGKGVQESAKSMYSLRAGLIDLQVPLDEGLADFNAMSATLASLGPNAIESYMEIRQLGKETGLATDTMNKLDEQMYTFEGASTFAQQMNQVLGSNIFDHQSLMEAWADGPAAVTKMVKAGIDSSGKNFESMKRAEKRLIADKMGIGIDELGKMMSGQIGILDDELGKTDDSMKSAQMDAQSRMKSNEELLKNQAKLLKELPAGAAEKHMRGMQDAMAGTVLSTSTVANDMTIAAAESLKAATAVGTMTRNAARAAADTPAGSFMDALGTMFLGLLAALPHLPKLLTFFGGTSTTLASIGTVLGTTVLPALFLLSQAYLAITHGMDGFTRAQEQGLSGWMTFSSTVGGIFEGLAFGWQKLMKAIGLGKSDDDGIDRSMVGQQSEALRAQQVRIAQINLLKKRGREEDLAKVKELQAQGMKGMGTKDVGANIQDGMAAGFSKNQSTVTKAVNSSMEAVDTSMNDYWEVSSPSKRSERLVDNIVSPFASLRKRVEPHIKEMMDVLPEPLREAMGGDTSNLGKIAASSNTTNSDILSMVMDVLGADTKKEQQIALSFELDGREVDKKILNVVGGVVQPLVT